MSLVSLSDFFNTENENPEIVSILNTVCDTAAKLNIDINKAGISKSILGAAGAENVQGEAQQKLDVIADEMFIDAFKQNSLFGGLTSEENDSYLNHEQGFNSEGKYLIAMDPLDGSSNIDVNVSIGTIISVFERLSIEPVTEKDFFQKGVYQKLGAYVLYGSSCMLVYTSGNGSHAFTLNPEDNTFYLTQSHIKAPEKGKIYSINEGNINSVSQELKDYVAYCQSSTNDTGKPYSARYIGSLVADFHRNLLKGGIYIYPSTASAPEGKLRLLYEANPLAFIAEQAGAKANDGKQRIMEIEPNKLHQRCPLYIGSKNMIEKATGL